MRKYRNKPTTVDGIRFDSKKEATRWWQLSTMGREGQISHLRRQVRFPLEVAGRPVCTYVADFVYEAARGTVVEDAKGVRTAEHRVRMKLFNALHPATPIREV